MKNRNNLLLGLLLIVSGIFFLLVRFDVFNIEWRVFFGLWPVVLFLIGIFFLPIKAIFKVLLMLLVFLGAGFVYEYQLEKEEKSFGYRYEYEDYYDEREDGFFDDEFAENESDHDSIKFEESEIHIIRENSNEAKKEEIFVKSFNQKITSVNLKIDCAVASYILEGTTKELIQVAKEGVVLDYKFVVKETEKEEVDVLLYPREDNAIRNNMQIKRLGKFFVKLNPKPIWNIDLNAGVADVQFDLSSFKVESLDIEGGASNIEIKMGDLHPQTKIELEAGVANVVLSVPEITGCQIVSSTALVGKNFIGFTEVEKGLYRTSNFDTAKRKIYIDIDAAISGLEVKRYSKN